MPGGTFWEEEDGFYYSYEDWVNGKECVDAYIVLGENPEDITDVDWN